MKTKYLKQFRKRFSWYHLPCGRVKVFDHKRKKVNIYMSIIDAMGDMILSSQGFNSYFEFFDKKEKVKYRNEYFNEIKNKQP